MNIKKKIIIILFLVGLFGLFVYRSSYSQKSSNKPIDASINSENKTKIDKNAPNKVEFANAVLEAYSYYYLSKQAPAMDENEDIILQSMTILLKQNNDLKRGNLEMTKYLKDPNQVISVSALGMITGANKIISANEQMIKYLENINYDDPNFQEKLDYQIAKLNTDKNEGYKLMLVSGPQVTGLFFDYPSDNPPTGKIPYLISRKDRSSLLEKIDFLFGDDLKQNPRGQISGSSDYDSILAAIYAFQNNILPETYEEASSLNK